MDRDKDFSKLLTLADGQHGRGDGILCERNITLHIQVHVVRGHLYRDQLSLPWLFNEGTVLFFTTVNNSLKGMYVLISMRIEVHDKESTCARVTTGMSLCADGLLPSA